LKFIRLAGNRSFILRLFVLLLAGFYPLYGADWAFPAAACGHRGAVSAVFQRGGSIISAGEDGFIGIWNVNNGAAVDRFQASPRRIIAMAGRPGKDEACIVENDGLGLYWISAWNYRERRKIFTLQFRDPIGHISYSAGGKFIIAARAGRTALVMIDANTGSILQSPQSLTGTAGLVVTGRSERNMMVYLASGEISYWDIETGNRTNTFSAPPNLHSPALFSNNRYLAGVDAEGLAVVHAASGEILGRDASIPNGSLLCADGGDFICLVQKNNTATPTAPPTVPPAAAAPQVAELYRFTVDNSGRFIARGNFSISVTGMDDQFTAIGAGSATGAALFGTSSGSLAIAASDGQTRLLSAKEQTFITDAAVSGSTLAFISDNGYIGFLPLDYQQLSNGSEIRIEKNDTAYNRITAFDAEPEQEGSAINGSAVNGAQFIFWHDKNTRLNPAIRSSEPGSQFKTLNGINARSPIHSAASFGGKALFLDTTGNLSVAAPAAEKNPLYTFFSVGLMDAAFIDSDRLLLGRSAVSGNTPFMIINLNTGETVPLPHPSQAVTALYRGGSGAIYAVTVSSQPAEDAQPLGETTGIRTQVILFNPDNSADSIKLIDFQGEDTQFSLAESPEGHAGSIAATIGNEGAIYSSSGLQKLDRTAGLPHRLLEGGHSLISLDRDGNICWHDSRNGRLAAVFSLYPSGWTLRTEKGSVRGEIK
jgi:WD40 repeat protein